MKIEFSITYRPEEELQPVKGFKNGSIRMQIFLMGFQGTEIIRNIVLVCDLKYVKTC